MAFMYRHKVNPTCIMGKPKLLTVYKPEYPVYDETYEKIPPINMPEELIIDTREKAKKMIHSDTLVLDIDGQQLPFQVSRIEWGTGLNSYKWYIELRSGKWWGLEPFTVRYVVKK